jgi:hypothetical protein
MLTFYVIRQSHTSGHPFYSEFTPHHSGSSSVYTQERPQLQSLHTLLHNLRTPGVGGSGTGGIYPDPVGSLCSFIPFRVSTNANAGNHCIQTAHDAAKSFKRIAYKKQGRGSHPK